MSGVVRAISPHSAPRLRKRCASASEREWRPCKASSQSASASAWRARNPAGRPATDAAASQCLVIRFVSRNTPPPIRADGCTHQRQDDTAARSSAPPAKDHRAHSSVCQYSIRTHPLRPPEYTFQLRLFRVGIASNLARVVVAGRNMHRKRNHPAGQRGRACHPGKARSAAFSGSDAWQDLTLETTSFPKRTSVRRWSFP